MSRITNWKKHDPFENVLFEFPIRRDNESISLDRLSHKYFGQCWTLTKESDLMWQMYRYRYAENGGVVKLETTIGDLLNSISELNFVHIGKVKYLSKPKLISHSKYLRDNFENLLQFDGGTGRVIAEMLLIKRFPYHQEKEVRLLVNRIDLQKNDCIPSFLNHKVKIEKLISKVVFDPTFSDKDFSKEKSKLKIINSNLKIIRSNLYKLDTIDFFIV